MIEDRKQSNIKQGSRAAATGPARPSKSGWRAERLSIVKKGSNPSAEMGEWVIDEAD